MVLNHFLTSSCVATVLAGVYLLGFCGTAMGQESADSAASVSPAKLTTATANVWAEMVLKGIDTEFPNKMSIVYADRAQIKPISRSQITLGPRLGPNRCSLCQTAMHAML